MNGRALPARNLGRYVEQVAEALGLPAGGVSSDVSDTATGYLALNTRHPAHPDRDLMLTWDATVGWSLATEPTAPADPSVVLAHLTGDVLPAPRAVARFTEHALTGHCYPAAAPEHRPIAGKARPGSLADRVAAYTCPIEWAGFGQAQSQGTDEAAAPDRGARHPRRRPAV